MSSFIWKRDCDGDIRYWTGLLWMTEMAEGSIFDDDIEAEMHAGMLAGESVNALTGRHADRKLPTAEKVDFCPQCESMLHAMRRCTACGVNW